MSYLWIPQLRAQNVNAQQSPFVYGVPSPPTWIGFADALMRDIGVEYSGVGALVQRFEALAHGFTRHFAQSRHPLKKNGDVGAIIEEAKGHLRASLLIELMGDIDLSGAEIASVIGRKRLAGGFIQPIEPEHWPRIVSDDDPLAAKGHWLTITDQRFDSLDDWVDATQAHHQYDQDKGKWEYRASDVVPLMVGYAALKPPSHNLNSRDPSCPLVRVEAIHGAGKWVPHRQTIDKQSVLFRRSTDLSAGLFICH